MDSSLPNFDLSGKTAVITGGAGLLGEQHAIALLECGATVVLTDLQLDRIQSVTSRLSDRFGKERIHGMCMDVTSLESIQSVYKTLCDRTQGVQILVNNAAVDPKVSSSDSLNEKSRFEHFPRETWDFQLDVGLTGAFQCCQVFGHAMATSKEGGVILNIASDLSVISPDQRLYRKPHLPEHLQPVKPVTYSVLKTALIGLTRYLATYWSAHGVRVNALSPGGVYNNHPEEFVARISQLIPLGRMAKLNEYQAAVQFLCSNASSYMTGQNIVIDGGRSIL